MAELIQTDRRVKAELERVSYGMAEAAEAVGLGLTMFSEFVTSGRIVSFRVGRRRLIRKADLQRFVDSLVDEQQNGKVV